MDKANTIREHENKNIHICQNTASNPRSLKDAGGLILCSYIKATHLKTPPSRKQIEEKMSNFGSPSGLSANLHGGGTPYNDAVTIVYTLKPLFEETQTPIPRGVDIVETAENMLRLLQTVKNKKRRKQ